MENNFSEFEESKHLTDKQVFTLIWTEPRMIFQYIIEKKYKKYFLLLVVLAGIANALDRASLQDKGDKSELSTILFGSIIGGALLGWLSFYIYSALLSWTGKWISGKGNTEMLYRSLIYSQLPTIVALFFVALQILLYGKSVFTSELPFFGSSLFLQILFYFLIICEVALGIWSFVLTIVGISEVQKFSIGKALLNILLAILVIIIPILLLVLLFFNT